ncbi:MAG TPA: formyltransferase [Rhodanobacteraceae bacterium]
MTPDPRTRAPRAIVFAYHNVGVRALEVLLACGYDIPLVFTHEDDPNEGVWFASVTACARRNGIEVATPEQAELPHVASRITELAPDFIFSFYYRYMIPAELLALAPRGALNLHGSLLPRYRGRAPVNWAVLAGESETGASLHYMTAKPDAGDLVGQQAVPILPNDTAADVMTKITVAGECLLWRLAPALAAGTAPRMPLDLAAGNYRGRRRPEDGRVDWSANAWAIHNLVRAVAPPYPGAFTDTLYGRLGLLGSHYAAQDACHSQPSLYVDNDRLYVDCRDGKRFQLLQATLDGQPLTAASLPDAAASGVIPLDK